MGTTRLWAERCGRWGSDAPTRTPGPIRLPGDDERIFATAMKIVESLYGDVPPIKSEKAVRNAWQACTALADKYNEPGRFTALILAVSIVSPACTFARQASYWTAGTARGASRSATARADCSPSGIVPGTRSKSVVVMSPMITSRRMSRSVRLASCWFSFAMSPTSRLRRTSVVAVRNFSRCNCSSTRFTTMTTSAHMSRPTSTGMLWTMPPSDRTYWSVSTGANAPGIAMPARMAVARSPLPSTTMLPVGMSVATARQGDRQLVEVGLCPGARHAGAQQVFDVAGVHDAGGQHRAPVLQAQLELILRPGSQAWLPTCGPSPARPFREMHGA